MDKQHEMKAGSLSNNNMLPERYDNETFIEELKKSNDPDKMSWMMLNFLIQKMAEDIQDGGESGRYSDARYSDSRSQGMNNSSRRGYARRLEYNERGMGGYPANREYNSDYGYDHESGMDSSFRSRRRSRYASEDRIHEAKERIGQVVGHELDDEEIKCLIIKEAASLIKKISECEDYEALKEFNELCMAMKGYSENLPEELEEQAKEEAISGYARMFLERHSYRSRRIGYDERERRGERRLPVIEIEEFGRRGRRRDSMGRFI